MSTKAGNPPRGRTTQAFTLVEAMISMSLTCLLVVGVASALSYICRTQYSIANYCKMDQEARRALELVGRDIKLCAPKDSTNPLTLTFTSADDQSFSMGIPAPSDSASTIKVTYRYLKSDSTRGGKGTLTRSVRNLDGTSGSSQVLIENVTAFKLSGSTLAPSGGDATIYTGMESASTNAALLKQLQIELTTMSGNVLTKVAGQSSQQIISAQYSIRK